MCFTLPVLPRMYPPKVRVLLGATFWTAVGVAAVEASKRSADIAWAAEVAKRNARDFIQRRLTTPTVRCACARLECTATIRGGAYAV